MTEQGEDHSREKRGGDSEILNYARLGAAKTSRKVPISGVLSFVAMLIQIPWGIKAFFFIAMMYYDPGRAGVKYPLPSDRTIFIVWVVAFLPTLVGLPCGCYSVKVAGISWRNAFGVLGLVLVAVLIALITAAVVV
jgi:hypothetical protein